MAAPTYFLTGATGLVGAAIALELLADPDTELWCLVRPRGGRDGQLRLEHELNRAAVAYGRSELAPDVRARCHAVPGNLAYPVHPPAVSHVWRVGASLRYEEVFTTAVRRANVTGTQHVLAAAERVGAQFNHVSTASIAPCRDGSQRELPPDDTSVVHNLYERTKLDAELVTLRASVPWRVLRPVMVVGHSRTHAVTTFSGLYAFALRLLRFHRRYGSEAAGRVLALRGAADAEVHFVPVDQVVRNAVRIGLAGPTATIYHLANTQASAVADLYGAAFSWLGLPAPRCVAAGEPLDGIERELDTVVGGFGDYFSRLETYDRTNALVVVGAGAMSSPMTADTITALLTWYSDHTRTRSDIARQQVDVR